MKPHKHAKLIKAWADGAIIQWKDHFGDWNESSNNLPHWDESTEYRIKPEPKPDEKVFLFKINDGWYIRQSLWVGFNAKPEHHICLTFDGETGELKLAEVLK